MNKTSDKNQELIIDFLTELNFSEQERRLFYCFIDEKRAYLTCFSKPLDYLYDTVYKKRKHKGSIYEEVLKDQKAAIIKFFKDGDFNMEKTIEENILIQFSSKNKEKTIHFHSKNGLLIINQMDSIFFSFLNFIKNKEEYQLSFVEKIFFSFCE